MLRVLRNRIFHTLYGRLILVLIVLFSIASAVLLYAAVYTAHMYQQEITQRLNRELAAYIARERVLIENGTVRQDNLKKLFHEAMIINPALELYLLDDDGRVLAYSDTLGEVRRKRIDLGPVKTFLQDNPVLPVMGDDPRNHSRQQVFSVAPIEKDGHLQGYIYAILGGERFEHITQLIQNSYILKWSAVASVVVPGFALLAGGLIFYLLTRKLRRLSQAMADFSRQNRLGGEGDSLTVSNAADSDEIDRMTTTFNAMAERIQLQMQRLRETDALRRELVANVSHDLRTPLSSLKGYLETLKLKGASLDEAQREHYLDIAHDHAERLSKLVVELFELAKLDANELKPQKERFSLAELASDVSQKFALRAQQAGIRLQIEVEPALPFVEADLGMIERVLDNLIDNAFKHTPKDGEIRIAIQSLDDAVQISVADTGYGIAEEHLPHVFKRFYRQQGARAQTTDEAKSPRAGGAGLGLAIANRIVELHGGKLSVSSVLHKGTVFRFSLPL